MKKIYSKPLFRLFQERMCEQWPEFKPYPYNSLPKDLKGYCSSVVWDAGVVKIFIEILVSHKPYDEFFCEFMWTTITNDRPTFDWNEYRFPFLNPKSAFDDQKGHGSFEAIWRGNCTETIFIKDPMYIFREAHSAKIRQYPVGWDATKESREAYAREDVKRLMAAMAETDVLTPEDGERLAGQALDELFQKLEQYVIPYFREFIEHRN